MKTAEINDWLQVAGLVGVIVSLIFVGLQLRQDRQFAYAVAATDAAESSKYWAELLAGNAELWTKGISGQKLTDHEYQAFSALADAFFLRWQSAWMRWNQFEQAGDDADRFAKEAALHIHLNPGLKEYWSRRTEWIELVNGGDNETNPTRWVAAVNEQLSIIQMRAN